VPAKGGGALASTRNGRAVPKARCGAKVFIEGGFVALNRGIQGSRNTGVPMTYGEAYQRLFPTVEEILK